MKIFKTEGIIIKRKNAGETDRAITLLTKDQGKIKIMAKGVRRISSRRSGSLELFNQCRITVRQGQTYNSLEEVDLVNDYSEWRQDLKAIGVAYYLCELIDKFTAENQENQLVYELLYDSFRNLPTKNYSLLVTNFEKRLLTILGFGVPQNLVNSPKSLKEYLEKVSGRKIYSPKIIKEIW